MKRVWLIIILVLCQIVAILSPFRCFYAILKGDYERTYEILKAYDRLGNADFNGKSNETISSRANRARKENAKWGCMLCRLLNKIEHNHCQNSDGI